jgi:hypothetical protein
MMLFLWGFFTFILWIQTFRMNVGLSVRPDPHAYAAAPSLNGIGATAPANQVGVKHTSPDRPMKMNVATDSCRRVVCKAQPSESCKRKDTKFSFQMSWIYGFACTC